MIGAFGHEQPSRRLSTRRSFGLAIAAGVNGILVWLLVDNARLGSAIPPSKRLATVPITIVRVPLPSTEIREEPRPRRLQERSGGSPPTLKLRTIPPIQITAPIPDDRTQAIEHRASRVEPDSAPASPTINLDGATLRRAMQPSPGGISSMAQAAGVPLSSGRTSSQALAQSVEEAERRDCRNAHSDKGLLAPFFLARDAASSQGCKW